MRISDWSSDVGSSDRGIGVLVTPGGVTGMRPATLDAEIAGVALVRAMRDAAAMDQQVHVRVVAGNVEDRRVTRFLQHQRVRRISDGPEIGRESCRERVCKYVWISVLAVS